MNTLLRLSDGRAPCLHALPFSVAAGGSVAAQRKSREDFQIMQRVCFTQLAKPDG